MIFLISFVFMGIGMLVQWRLKSKFKEYSEVALSNGYSGAQVAEKMLHENGIYDVKITQVEGQMTDHYDPTQKTVNLSPDVFAGRSVSAAAVAAHECGHAVQHATAYKALGLRSAMVPVVSFCTNVMNYFYMFGIFGMGYFLSRNTGFSQIILLGLVLANVALVAFSLITLPVEFDASNRALKWMEQRGIVNNQEHGMAKDALHWAAMTYVVAALGAVAQLVYYLSMFLGSRRND